MYGNYLSHYGVLGMHWGRRKGGGSLVSIAKKSRPKKEQSPGSQDHQVKVYLKKKKIRDMSNAELRVLNERMQLERTYKDLKRQDMSVGKQVARDILVSAGKQTASTYAVKGIGAGVSKLLTLAL